MSFPPVDANWFLTGPTASGKTEVALALAERLGAEILSLDSMAVYRGMEIGTAKPTLAERRCVPHHLVDLIEIDLDFSIAEYVAAAHEAVADIKGRGRTPLFVGGTPLYLKALLRGLFVGPQANWPLRQQLSREADEHGAAELHRRLATVDPPAAARLHPNDLRRNIRALEVFETTGTPISAHQRQFAQPRPAEECRCYVLDRPRDELYRRIDARVHAMFASGMVEETAALLASGKTFGRTAGQAVGYREVLEHLGGQRSLEETIALVKTRTRQFAKRQQTWFRSLAECQFVPLANEESPQETANRLCQIAS